MANCPYCGQALTDGTEICPACGGKGTTDETAENYAIKELKQSKNLRIKRRVLISGGAVLIFLFLFLFPNLGQLGIEFVVGLFIIFILGIIALVFGLKTPKQ